MALFRISFEYVNPTRHPEHYCPHGIHPCVVRELVADAQWTAVSRVSAEADDIHGQFQGLTALIAQGELIRNVRISRTPPEPATTPTPAR